MIAHINNEYRRGGSTRRGGGKTQIWPPKINIFTNFFFGKFKENLNLEESKKIFFWTTPFPRGGQKTLAPSGTNMLVPLGANVFDPPRGNGVVKKIFFFWFC